MAGRRGTRTVRKTDLRAAYEMGGYTGDYARFVRNKVVPIIGESALHPIAARAGSRVREYNVTQRNLHRVIKALGIDNTRYNQVQAVKKAVRKAGPDAIAEVIMKLVEGTEQPKATDEYPINFKIPLHPISHNMLYAAKGSRFVKTARYKTWRKKFFPLIQSIVKKTGHGVDFTKPLEAVYYYGHREVSKSGGVFDRQNFTKALQDCVSEHLGFDDNKVLESSIKGEFVENYAEGFMEVRIRNV